MNAIDKESTQGKAIELLNKLLTMTIAGKEIYHTASEDIQRPELKTYFLQRSRDCAKAEEDLAAEVAGLGGKPEPSSPLGAKAHRFITELRNAVSYGHSSDLSILAEVERHERYVRDEFVAYQKSYADLPATSEHGKSASSWLSECLSGVQKNLEEVERLHTQVKEEADKKA